MSANNIIFIDRKNFKVYYQGTADNDDLGSLEGQGKTIEEAIDIAQKIIEECGEVEYGIKFISSRKYTEKHTKPTQPSSSKPDKSVQDNATITQQSRNKNIQDIVDKHYDQMFQELIELVGDDFYDLEVDVIDLNGLTIRRSWREREERLNESSQNETIDGRL